VNILTKFGHALRLAPTRPVEFCDRVTAYVEARWQRGKSSATYTSLPFWEGLHWLEERTGLSLRTYLDEQAFHEIQTFTQERLNQLPAGTGFARSHDADTALAGCVYAFVRAIAAKTVVETGVAHGVSTAFILQALAENGRGGRLFSIDLPPLARDGDRYVGLAVPEHLRPTWHLEIGPSKRRLPAVLSRAGVLDVFLHDSLHTESNMRLEFKLAWDSLRKGGVLISDDVEENPAFRDFVEEEEPCVSLVLRQMGKDSLVGLMVKDG